MRGGPQVLPPDTSIAVTATNFFVPQVLVFSRRGRGN